MAQRIARRTAKKSQTSIKEKPVLASRASTSSNQKESSFGLSSAQSRPKTTLQRPGAVPFSVSTMNKKLKFANAKEHHKF